MAVSSNTLFHFTDSLEVLCKILEEGFWPKYSKETGWKSRRTATVATSMVSFCDIPLSQIHRHIKYYGSYGIGVSKKWGVQAQLIPVNYITNKEPSLLKKIKEKALDDRADEKKKKGTSSKELFFSQMKVYKSWNWKVKGKEDWKWGWIEGNERNEQKAQGDVEIFLSYIYYDEREWRYIPKKLKADCCIPFRKNTDLDEWNNKTKAYCIKPDLGDIKYLIINSEDERMVLLEKLDRLFGGHKTADEMALLKSKILTCKQIREDF